MNFSNIRGTIKKDYNLEALTWFKVGGSAEIFFKPSDLEDLVLFLKQNSNGNPLKLLGNSKAKDSNIAPEKEIHSSQEVQLLKNTSLAYTYPSLEHLSRIPDQADFPMMVLGAGSNIIIRDGGISGVVIKLTREFCDIEIYHDHSFRGVDFTDMLNDKSQNIANDIKKSECDDHILLSVGAGCLNYNLAKFAANNSIAGLEFMACIPGGIGGGIAMNAGAYGKEFKDIVVAVEAIDRYGNIYVLLRDQIGFEYRKNNLPQGLIYTKAILQAPLGQVDQIQQKMDYINESRNLSQPMGQKTGGSSFANPEITILEAYDKGYVNDDFISKFTNDNDDLSLLPLKAWQLIDYAGLRGKQIGGAEMSKKHCNFMINHGNATARDIEDLGDHVRKMVHERTGIMLKWEIKRVGNKL